MSEDYHTAAKGAFLFGAVFFAGLIIAGGFALKCGLVGAAAAYLAQVVEAYRLAGHGGHAAVLGLWAVSVIAGVTGLIAVIGA